MYFNTNYGEPKIYFIVKDFIVEPLGIMQLSAVLKAAGYKVDILKTDKEDIFTILDKGNFILLYSVLTGSQQYFANLNYQLKFLHKQGKLFSVFGGPHPTYFSQYIEEEGIDVICIGEGEYSLLQLISHLFSGKDYTTIPNCHVKVNGVVIKNDLLPLIQNLDLLPFPDRELIYKYNKHRDNPIKNFMGTRGCEFSCSYCFNSSAKKLYHNQKFLRHRSPEFLINEILQVKRDYPLSFVFFQDDNFILNSAWIEEVLDLYEKKVKLPFHCQLRVEKVTEDLIKHLFSAGCHSVTFAIESANSNIRKNILKREMSTDLIVKAAYLIKEAGLKLRTENMLGIPTETIKDMFETVKLNIKCIPTVGWASIYQPYPRTALGQYCNVLNLWDGENDFKETFFEQTNLKLKKRHKRIINNLQKLFGVVVKYPKLLPLIRLLVRLPENRFYNKFSIWFRRRLYAKELYAVKGNKL